MTSEKEFPSDKADKFLVRLPEGMRDRIAEAAKANNRSMNAEIVSRLEASFHVQASVHQSLGLSSSVQPTVLSADSRPDTAPIAEVPSADKVSVYLTLLMRSLETQYTLAQDARRALADGTFSTKDLQALLDRTPKPVARRSRRVRDEKSPTSKPPKK